MKLKLSVLVNLLAVDVLVAIIGLKGRGTDLS
jgi:hypothetical protein